MSASGIGDTRFPRALALLLIALAAVAMLPHGASALVPPNKPQTIVAPTSAAAVATYTFARYRTEKNEEITGFSITFPANTIVTGATADDPAGSVVVSGQTVTVTFTTPVPEKSNFTITLGNITNPGAGTYNAGDMSLFWRDTSTGATATLSSPTEDYVIIDSYLSLTITTPDVGQSVQFGSIDPGLTTPSQTVTVTVDSSAPFTITRATGGDDLLLGLAVTGTATGLKPQGLATYTDDYTLTPPWTTDPSVPLTATVTYTVTQ